VEPRLLKGLKWMWFAMLTPPWRSMSPGEERGYQITMWVVGWMWAVAGIILGAVIAPYILATVGIANSQYQDALVIGVAAVAGFLVQFAGWCLEVVVAETDGLIRRDSTGVGNIASLILIFVVFPLPFVVVGYAIYV
jgi:hypothetical protein